MQTEYIISFFNGCFDNVPKQKELTFENILTYFNTKVLVKYETKEQQEAMICGIFDGQLRTKEQLKYRSIITYDIDKYSLNLDLLINYISETLSAYTYIYYTTRNSTYDNPRLRLLLFVNKIMESYEYESISRSVAKDLFNNEFLNGIDNSSYSAMQLMYLPNKINNEFRSGKHKNNLFDITKYENIKEVQEERQIDLISDYNNLPLNLTLDKIYYILNQYSCVETDYHSWFQVCQALHHQFCGGEEGLLIFKKWSSTDSDRYDENNCNSKYNSLKNSRKNPITFASIIKLVNDKKKIPTQINRTDNVYQEVPVANFVHTKLSASGKTLKAKSTYENFKIMCNYYQIKVSYDIITKDIINSFEEKDSNNMLGKFYSIMVLNDFDKGLAGNYMNMLAHENKINSLKLILDNVTWDGKERFKDLCDTVVVDEQYEKSKNLYLLKWFQQMLYLSLHDGDKKIGRNLLVLQGKQRIGKSTWVKSLMPKHLSNYVGEGLTLNTNDTMSILSCIKNVIVELSELEQSFKKTDINQFKAFFGRTKDTLNIKYLPCPVTYHRTTSFIGTINDEAFLKDRSGSTRFLIIPVIKLNGHHDIDMLQLYKEILETTDYEKFELSDEQHLMQQEINKEFEQPDLIEEQFLEIFDINNEDGEYLNYTQILEQIGYNKKDITHSRRIDIANVIKKYKFKFKKSTKKWLLKLKTNN